MLRLTDDQQGAMDSISSWLVTAQPNSIFRLFGLAGCGKTTCSVNLKKIINPKNGNRLRVLYIAYTNRAVSVLEDKGCKPAKTLHSVMYDVSEHTDEEKAEHRRMRMAYLA